MVELEVVAVRSELGAWRRDEVDTGVSGRRTERSLEEVSLADIVRLLERLREDVPVRRRQEVWRVAGPGLGLLEGLLVRLLVLDRVTRLDGVVAEAAEGAEDAGRRGREHLDLVGGCRVHAEVLLVAAQLDVVGGGRLKRQTQLVLVLVFRADWSPVSTDGTNTL